jgi:hypothetical protein
MSRSVRVPSLEQPGQFAGVLQFPRFFLRGGFGRLRLVFMAIEVAVGVCFAVRGSDGSNSEFKINPFPKAGRVPMIREQKDVLKSVVTVASLCITTSKALDWSDILDFSQEDSDPVENLVHVVGFQKFHRHLVVAVRNDRNIPGVDGCDGLIDFLAFLMGRWFMPVF